MMRRLGILALLLLSLAVVPGAPATSATSVEPRAGCHRTLASYPVVEPGDRGRAVRTLQCALNDAGYGPVTVDGRYGPETRSGVRRVEKTFEGDPPDPGRVNNGFWTLLFGRQLPSRVLRLGDHGPAVKVLQRALRAAGGDLVVDGDFGPQTRSVVRAYQRHWNYRPTGRTDQRTVFMLAQGGVFGRLS